MLKRSAAFRHPAFARWWVGNFVASVGRYWQLLTLAGYLAVRDGVLSSALVAAAGFGPGCIAAPLGGFLSDRGKPVAIVRASAACLVAVSVVLALAVSKQASSTALLLLVAVQGFLLAVAAPASAVMLHALLPDRALERGLGLLNYGTEAGRLLGALAAAFVLSGKPIMSVCAAGVGQAALLLSTLSPSAAVTTQPAAPPTTRRLSFGWLREALEIPAIRVSLAASAALHLLAIPYLGLTAAKAGTLQHDGWLPSSSASLTGLLSAAGGLGAAAASLWFARRVQRGRIANTMLVWSAATGATVALLGMSTRAIVALGAVLAVGFASQLALSATSLLIHVHAPAAFRGRVFGVRRALIDLTYAAGLAVLGYLIGAYGFEILIAAGVLVAAIGAGLARVLGAVEAAAGTCEAQHERTGA